MTKEELKNVKQQMWYDVHGTMREYADIMVENAGARAVYEALLNDIYATSKRIDKLLEE